MTKLGVKLRRDLLTNRWLFLAVTIVIICGVALYCSSILAFLNLKSSYDYSYEKLNFADFTISVVSAPPDTVNELDQIQGISAVTGRLNTDMGMEISGENGHSLVVRAISVPSQGHPRVNDLKIEDGNYVSPGKNEILLEKSFAEYHQLKPGDSVTLNGTAGTPDFTVAGIVTSPEYIFPAKSRSEFFVSPETWGVVFIPDEVLPELVGSSNINEFCILVDKTADPDAILAQSQDKLAQYTIVDVITQDTQPSNSGLKMDLQEFGEIADIFPVLFLFVGAMTTYILITRIIQRQRSQLGLMRALGYSRRQILLHYLSLALIIGITGAVAGVIAGYFLAGTITRLYVGMLGLPYTVTETSWLPIEEGLFIGILPSLIAGIFPAMTAARLRPAEAMRTPPPAAGRKPLLEKALPFLKNMPLLWKMPLRNIFRNRRRSISTVLGVVFGTVLILSSSGFIDSMDYLFTLQFDQIQKYDARLTFAQPQPETAVDSVATWSGVNKAAPVLSLPATMAYNGKSFTTLVAGMTVDNTLYGLYTTEGKRTGVAEGQVLLASAIRDKLGVQIGDTIVVSSYGEQEEFQINGFVKQPMGSYGYITLSDAQKLVGGQSVISEILLSVDDNAIADLRDTAAQNFSAVSVEVTSEVRSQMMGLMDLVYGLMWVMLGFGAVLALMVVFTMITVSLMERRREIATMRTLGETNGHIAGIVTIENLILGIAGLIIGIPLGYAVTSYMMRLFQTDMFSFELVFYARTYLLAAAIIVIIMLLSEIPGIRSLAHLDLAKVTKEQVT